MHRSRLFVFFYLLTAQIAFAQVVDVSGVITQNTTWTANKTYLLNGYVYVKGNATLTIEPGTVIKGDKASKATLIITRGSKIIADGTPTQPIVFTSNQTTPAPGDWGGVIVLGYAPTNAFTNGKSCLGIVEGGVNTPQGDALYGGGDQPGGCITTDNSGVLRYVRIEYAGVEFQFNNEINGLTMAGVGSGTLIDYVQVSYSFDDSFEWFGGTVNCKHLISYCAADDDFDCDLGYQGNIQFAFAIRNPTMDDVSGSNGLEIDNDASGTPAIPKTRPTFSNITIIGPSGPNIADNFRRAAHLRRNSETGIFNSVLLGNFPVGLFVDGVAAIANAQNGLLEVKNTRVAGAAELLKTTEATFNINQWFGNNNWGNATSANTATLGLQDPFNTATPNAQPVYTSVLRSGAGFSATRLNHSFFDKVNYIGAFGGFQDWTCTWAKFQEINTSCMVSADDAAALLPEMQIQPSVISGATTTLRLVLAQKADIQVDIIDMQGHLISQPVRQMQASTGEQLFSLNTETLTNGLYFVRVRANGSVRTEKMIVVR